MSSDAAICPLCHRANHCARAENPKASHCWCQQHTFAPAQCARATPTVCLCQACATEKPQPAQR